ncbi:uncharacterized protein LOC126790550 isoform X2 [Argentina anserina]|uniref:uncharacterized protein LOC126790550 isoform X2 n=1 Tax=Argentina anserina TaxID=57926 RepID=UPI0021766E2F|nr:uncharacterized protein LOC126790550 isoform X2 [Potentilla anserina]
MELLLHKKKFSLNHKDYTLYEEVGQGVSATVYRALCIPLDETVAIKVIDLEKCNNDMDMIRREVQTMILLDHPNLLKAHCSFIATRSLWIVMPYMAAGSCLHIMKSAHPDGFEENTIATLLHGVLKALAYLHSHGHIHRDVKAGNILVSSKGAVKLADFGVSTSLFESGNRLHSRKTFVGTPCWMAPEVMQQLHGYDFKADIWSLGITALELAHGHAPFSKYPPMKVLLMTLQNAPPGLDYERDKRFSNSFKELVAACLVKDQKKRPTADKLLKHRFFKHARSKEFIVRTIIDGLGPLGDRFRMLKQKEAELLGQNGEEHLSQQKYIRGISAWNFDLEDLKRQAALLQDDDGIRIADNQEWICKQKSGLDTSIGLVKRDSITVPVDSVSNSGSTWKHTDFKKFEEPVDSSRLSDQLTEVTEHQKRDNATCLHETALNEPRLQCNGKPIVTEPDSSFKDMRNGSTRPYFEDSVDSINGHAAASVIPALRCILHQNAMQMEETMRLIETVRQITGTHAEFPEAVNNKKPMQFSLASARERVLEAHVISIEKRIKKLVDELEIQKMKNAKLERQLSQVNRE